MTTRIVVPELGESVIEATVGEWFKQEGDQVRAGDVLVSLETDKVDVEVGAETSGVLSRIERQSGDDVAIGDLLGIIEGAGTAESANGEEPDSAPAEAAAPVEESTPEEEAASAEAPAETASTQRQSAEAVTPVARLDAFTGATASLST